jgi:hypothetical protein
MQNSFCKIVMVVFMIAHNVDHMLKPCCASLKEFVIAIAAIFWSHHTIWITLCYVSSHTDVAGQNQNLR